MEKKCNCISRKDFLSSTTKIMAGAAVGAVGLSTLAGKKTMANPNATWPYPYQTIDPEKARQYAHKLYWNDKDCCAGVFGGLVQCLAETIGEPWSSFPIEVMLYGRGGGVGWGATCGTLMGGAAFISLVTEKGPSGSLINELWGYYTTENLPTDTSNSFNFEVKKYEGALYQNISGSPLCHASVSQWCLGANKKVSDIERKERCARLAADIAAKTAEILNAHFSSTFTGTFADPASNATCMTCHGTAFNNVMSHMECATCHNDDPVHGGQYQSVEPIDQGVPTGYILENAYPNPFNPSTNIRFALPKGAKVRLEIYDIQGKLVSSLVDSEYMDAGSYQATWNGMNNRGEKVSSGIYLAKLTTGDFIKTVKLNLIK